MFVINRTRMTDTHRGKKQQS